MFPRGGTGCRYPYVLQGASVVVILLLLVAQSNLVNHESHELEQGVNYQELVVQALPSQHPISPPPDAQGIEDKIITEIIQLSKPGKSPRGKKYRSMICTLTRNDIHLREYVVRNLLAGFAHIVIYDNNHVSSSS